MTDHAAVSPSSAAMWLSCPASITKAAGRTRPSSKYAKEGTAAHTIAERIIQGDMFPPGKITVEGSEFIVGLPMLRALNPYISLVQSLKNFSDDFHIEAKVTLSWGAGMVWGTTDCAARIQKTLRIVDLKYGMGVPVSPDSAQLKIYALGAIDTFWPKMDLDRIHLTVVQPRLNPVPQTHAMSTEDLYYWHETELKPAVWAIQSGDETELPGPYCRWCVRKSECKAFKSLKNSMAADIFDDGLDGLNS